MITPVLESIYILRALNMGTCNQQGDLFYSAGLHDILEWTGLKFGKSQRVVENREKWKKMVAKSSVVPQRPSWVRD